MDTSDSLNSERSQPGKKKFTHYGNREQILRMYRAEPAEAVREEMNRFVDLKRRMREGGHQLVRSLRKYSHKFSSLEDEDARVNAWKRTNTLLETKPPGLKPVRRGESHENIIVLRRTYLAFAHNYTTENLTDDVARFYEERLSNRGRHQELLQEFDQKLLAAFYERYPTYKNDPRHDAKRTWRFGDLALKNIIMWRVRCCGAHSKAQELVPPGIAGGLDCLAEAAALASERNGAAPPSDVIDQQVAGVIMHVESECRSPASAPDTCSFFLMESPASPSADVHRQVPGPETVACLLMISIN